MRNRAGVETAERIVAATRMLLAERGLEATTVKAICDAADVRAGSFYNLFESKEELVLMVIRQAIRAVDPDPGRTGTESVADLVDAYVEFVTHERTIARVYLTVAVSGAVTDDGIRGRVLRHHEERIERFTAAMLRDRPDLSERQAREVMEALLAALNGYAFHSFLDQTFDLAGHARKLLELEPA
jgi:AcrR family transcriptional regulator